MCVERAFCRKGTRKRDLEEVAEADVDEEEREREEERDARCGRNGVLESAVFDQRLGRKGDGEAGEEVREAPRLKKKSKIRRKA